MLILADRAAHLERVIRPALADGKYVVCDRFFDSTRAYQGIAGGLGLEVIHNLQQPVLGTTLPDVTLLLDIDPEKGLSRAQERGGDLRFESKICITQHCSKCSKCKQKYKKTEIEDHVRNTHEREACPECRKRFETKELLEHHNFEEHLVEHCKECPKRFKEVEQLVDHSVTEHPKEQCPECESVFGLAKDLDEHKEKDHSKIMKFNGGMFMMMMAPE